MRHVTSKEEYSDKDAGTVISQSIRTGSNIVPSEETLEIIISKGKERTSSRDDSSTDSRSNDGRGSRNNSTRNSSSNNRTNNN